MQISIVEGDITTVRVHAVVTAGNRSLVGGSGVNGAVHAAAGPELLRASRALAPCHAGEAVVTPAFELRSASWVIHAVGPRYSGPHDEPVLTAAYTAALARADEVGARSVAFPSISTGAYGYPERDAARICVAALRAATTDVEWVVLVAFSERLARRWCRELARTGRPVVGSSTDVGRSPRRHREAGMRLSSQQTDRAIGALVGQAAGDALGVPYEFGSIPLVGEPQMLGGGLGGIAPGQWSDDTEMAVCIAEVAATGADLRTPDAQESIARKFLRWYADEPPDVGVQTRTVLGEARRRGGSAAEAMRTISRELHERTGRTAGNGSLMRTSPVALAHLGDAPAIADAARQVSALTHFDPVAGDACALWCLAIDHAVRTGELDVRVGLPHVDAAYWTPLLDEAQTVEPSHYRHSNGWVVAALLGAWSAISRTDGLVPGLHAAVAGGGDTDTVAAIAGQLLGAAYGASAVPARYRRRLHGWPGMRVRDLHRLAFLTVHGGRPGPEGWPGAASLPSYARAETTVIPHPDDPGVLLGAVGAVRAGVADAVVSLCRMGSGSAPLSGVPPEDHVEFWTIDKDDANNDLPGQLVDAAQAVRDLREEGKTVLVHCVHAHSRTPTVAAVYGAMVTGSTPREALDRVVAVLPSARPRRSFVRELERIVLAP